VKLITREIDYAVRALKSLAENGSDKVPVTDLVEELRITRPMLRKIMQELAKNGVVTSYKGNNGGFRLNKRPEDIYLIDIIEVFQGRFSMNECVLNKEICPNRGDCILKSKIEDIEADVKRKLESINLESLMDKKGDIKWQKEIS
jgi:Rrf2 family protein